MRDGEGRVAGLGHGRERNRAPLRASEMVDELLGPISLVVVASGRVVAALNESATFPVGVRELTHTIFAFRDEGKWASGETVGSCCSVLDFFNSSSIEAKKVDDTQNRREFASDWPQWPDSRDLRI